MAERGDKASEFLAPGKNVECKAGKQRKERAWEIRKLPRSYQYAVNTTP